MVRSVSWRELEEAAGEANIYNEPPPLICLFASGCTNGGMSCGMCHGATQPGWWREYDWNRGPLPGEMRKRQPLSRRVRAEVWKRDEGMCRMCGTTDSAAMQRDGEHLHFDHIIPFSKNGADTVANIQLLCGSCNRRKGAM